MTVPIRRKATYAVIAPTPFARTDSVGMKPNTITNIDERNATPETSHMPNLPPGILYGRAIFG